MCKVTLKLLIKAFFCLKSPLNSLKKYLLEYTDLPKGSTEKTRCYGLTVSPHKPYHEFPCIVGGTQWEIFE